jgi:glycosyltransferase involved in cell wall biosynthesis
LTDIVLIRSSSLIYDPRATKIIRSLNKRYRTSAIGWNREGIFIKESQKTLPINVDLFDMKAPFGKKSLVAYFPLFWIWVLFCLFSKRPRAVHACDLDSLIPAYIYKTIFRKKLVYDVFDRYAMSKISPKSRLLYSFVNSLEDILGSKADVLMTVSEKLLDTFHKKPANCAIVMNCPERPEQEVQDQIMGRSNIEDDDRSDNSTMTIVYTGAVVKKRGIERVIEALQGLSHIRFVIAGRVLDDELFNYISTSKQSINNNIKYEGLLTPSDAIALEARSHVMAILYDPDRPINKFAMPNKLFEAMMLGIPLITNVAPEIVSEANCGIMVDYNDISQIKAAIISLEDKGLRTKLGKNGRKAFEEKYNWNMMEDELFKVYSDLLE